MPRIAGIDQWRFNLRSHVDFEIVSLSILFVWRSQALSLIFEPLRHLERLFQTTEARNGCAIRGKVVRRFQS
jgi:hypothetical protein